MSKWGKRYLWACAGMGVVTLVWIGVEYYRWAVVNWDRQDLGG